MRPRPDIDDRPSSAAPAARPAPPEAEEDGRFPRAPAGPAASARRRPRSLAPAVACAAVLLLLLGVNLFALGRIRVAQSLTHHTGEARRALVAVLQELVDAETGQRGYLLTGKASYLAPFRDSERRMPEAVARARALVTDSPGQRQRMEKLAGAVGGKLRELSATVTLRELGHVQAALAAVQTDLGRRFMDDARALVTDLVAEENRVIDMRVAAAERGLTLSFWLTVAVAVGMGVLGLVFLAIHRDLARREALEASLGEAVRVRDDFLAIAGHELRTPLTALALQVRRMARLARSPEAPGAAGELTAQVCKIQSSVKRAAVLVDDLLDVSRLSARHLDLDREEIDLGAVTRECLDRFAEQAARARTPLEVQLEAVVIEADRARIEQVVVNLVANALKYGPGRPVTVSVRREGQSGVLRVRDRGIGVSAADHQRIFQRFERAVSGKNYGGLGLGLWISREIVDAHGGVIGLRSLSDGGTEFQVDLPLAVRAAPDTPPRSPTLPSEGARRPSAAVTAPRAARG